MSETAQRIATLIIKHLKGDLTEEEAAELTRWVNQSEENKASFEELTNKNILEKDLLQYAEIRERGLKKIKLEIEDERMQAQRKTWRYAAVAATVLMIIASAFLFLQERKADINLPAPIAAKPITPADIKPGTNRAILTLSDGTTVDLNSAKNGTIATETQTMVRKLADGQIVYTKADGSPVSNESKKIKYNTLSTPRGGQYDIVLSDGTKVWLNASSSINYPVAFTETERTVVITGEAYFEVSTLLAAPGGKEKIPFKVKIMSGGVEKGQVEVLGTHFNINAYDDEALVKTTLLEGSVKVSTASATSSRRLQPGQQAVLTNGSAPITLNSPDVDEVMAWKNGLFQFKGASIETIMRQAARWYDIDIAYTKKPSDKFTGKISRHVNLAGLLKILELSEVKYKLEEGRKLVITE